jgi:AAA domain-containing protein/bifunctional DNA primase/polymerase-like protein
MWQKEPGTYERFRQHTDGRTAFNVGIRLNADSSPSLVLLDVDTKHGKPGLASWSQLESECGPLPENGLLQTTPSGGRHYLLRVPEGTDPHRLPNRSDVLPGLDVFSHKKQFVLSPSRTPLGQYRFDDDRGLPAPSELPTLPPRWAERLLSFQASRATNSDGVSVADPAPDPNLVLALLDILPAPASNSRDDCVDFAYAVHGALGDVDPGILASAKEKFLCWAGRWPGANPDHDEAIWESTKGAKHRGWRHARNDADNFIARARQAGTPEESGIVDGADVAAAETLLNRIRLEDAQSAFAVDPNAKPPATAAIRTQSNADPLRRIINEVREAHDVASRLLAVSKLRKEFRLKDVEIDQALASLGDRGESPLDIGHQLSELVQHPELLESPKPAIPYLAYPGLKTLLSAREKTGKSTFALAGAAAASRGVPFLDEVTSPQTVLWVTEEPLGVVVRRAVEMQADPARFVIMQIGVNPPEQLQQSVKRWSPQIVVVDTLYRYAGVEDENAAALWLPIFAGFDEITRKEVALLLLVHASKASKKGQYRGSSAIGGHVDLILAMTAPDAGANRKLYAVGRIPANDFAVRLSPDRRTFELLGKPAPEAEMVDAVRSFLSINGPATKSKLRKMLQVGQARIDDALHRLIADDVVVPDGRQYRLVTAPEAFEKRQSVAT